MNLAARPDLLASSQVKAAEAQDLVPRKACWRKSQKQLSLCKMLQTGTKSRNPRIQLEKSETLRNTVCDQRRVGFEKEWAALCRHKAKIATCKCLI